MNAEPERRDGDGHEQGDRQGQIDLGRVLELLRPKRRRYTLDALREQEGEAAFNEVVDYVCREEFGLGYGTQERKRVYVALYQNHVPALDAAGVVVFEGTGDEDPVRAGPAFDRVVRIYDNLRETAAEEAVAESGRDDLRPIHKRVSDLFGGGGADENES